MWFQEYKEGLERLGIILFMTVFIAFALINVLAGSYAPSGTEEIKAIEEEQARVCDTDEWQLFSFMCRDRVLAKHRLARFYAAAGPMEIIVLFLVAGVIGYYGYRWAREGFRED